MRGRAFVLLGVCLFLTRTSEAAPAFRCGTNDVRQRAFTAGIDCSQRPANALSMTSSTHPIRVHYDAAHQSLAELVLSSAETSWRVTTEDLGFEAPPADGTAGGDARFDFYLEVSQYGGYFCPEGPISTSERIGYFGWVSINPDAFGPEHLPAVVAHELNHASQLGVDVIETQAFMEMTSAYVMEKVFDSVNLAAPYISYFQTSPEKSLDYYVYAEPYQYGASLFLFWLFDEKLANPALVSQVWDQAKQPYDPNVGNEPDFMDVLHSMATARGATLEEWYSEFAADRFFTGAYDDGTFTEGATYDSVELEGNYRRDNLPKNRLSDGIGELGAAYIRVDAGASGGGSVDVEIAGDDSTTWRVLLLRESDGSRGELALDADGRASFELTPGSNVLAVVNEGDANKDPDAHYASNDWDESTFTYSLSLDRGAAGCGCSLTRRPAAGAPVLSILALAVVPAMVVRRRCA